VDIYQISTNTWETVQPPSDITPIIINQDPYVGPVSGWSYTEISSDDPVRTAGGAFGSWACCFSANIYFWHEIEGPAWIYNLTTGIISNVAAQSPLPVNLNYLLPMTMYDGETYTPNPLFVFPVVVGDKIYICDPWRLHDVGEPPGDAGPHDGISGPYDQTAGGWKMAMYDPASNTYSFGTNSSPSWTESCNFDNRAVHNCFCAGLFGTKIYYCGNSTAYADKFKIITYDTGTGAWATHDNIGPTGGFPTASALPVISGGALWVLDMEDQATVPIGMHKVDLTTFATTFLTSASAPISARQAIGAATFDANNIFFGFGPL
jgi:hypothetical protein